nr:hypothetical protein [Tanacetum cinerariifolium]GFB30067.1 hypothetical protein [Tanacetum cinerariifolium]
YNLFCFKMQYLDIKDPKEEDTLSAALYHVVPSLQKNMETMSIILEQELLGYEVQEMKILYKKLCEVMQNHITEILGKSIDRTNCSLERSKNLIESGTHLRECGDKGRMDCIEYLSQAIVIMTDLSGGPSS